MPRSLMITTSIELALHNNMPSFSLLYSIVILALNQYGAKKNKAGIIYFQ
jgi:hypothetical protein